VNAEEFDWAAAEADVADIEVPGWNDDPRAPQAGDIGLFRSKKQYTRAEVAKEIGCDEKELEREFYDALVMDLYRGLMGSNYDEVKNDG
jgi:hypothetical protein